MNGDVHLSPTGNGPAFRWPLLAWLGNRMFLVVVSWLAITQLPMRSERGLWQPYPGGNPLNGWVRWDAGWYAEIARDGYLPAEKIQAGRQRNTAFFPLYPLVTRCVSRVVGDVYRSGLLVSNLAFLAALLLLHDMVRREHGEACARRTTSLLLWHPCSFFFSAMYTESLFLLCAVLFFRLAGRGRAGPAGLCAALAGATRVVGVLLAPALLIQGWRGSSSLRDRVRTMAPALLLALTGAASYAVFLAVRYGNPLEFSAAQHVEGWGTGVGFMPAGPMDVFNLLFLPLALILLWQGRRLLPPEQRAWVFLTLLLSLARWPSLSRLTLVLFPLFVVAAIKLPNRRVFASILAVSAVLLTLTTLRFALWYWVA